jgi:hypothetical protein
LWVERVRPKDQRDVEESEPGALTSGRQPGNGKSLGASERPFETSALGKTAKQVALPGIDLFREKYVEQGAGKRNTRQFCLRDLQPGMPVWSAAEKWVTWNHFLFLLSLQHRFLAASLHAIANKVN